MIYVMEDKGDSPLTLLYKSAFSDEVVKRMRFTKSSGEVAKISRVSLRDTNEQVYAFLDVVPDNPILVAEFMKLWRLHTENIGRMWTIPVVCSEYYLLKSVENTNLVVDKQLIDFGLHSDCHLLDSKWLRGRVRRTTYEKYCKHVVSHALARCFGDDDETRAYAYMINDCPCKNTINQQICTQRSLVDKAMKYVGEYPIIPAGSLLKNVKPISDQEYEAYIVQFVAEHNRRVQIYLRNFPYMAKNLNRCFIVTNDKGVPI